AEEFVERFVRLLGTGFEQGGRLHGDDVELDLGGAIGVDGVGHVAFDAPGGQQAQQSERGQSESVHGASPGSCAGEWTPFRGNGSTGRAGHTACRFRRPARCTGTQELDSTPGGDYPLGATCSALSRRSRRIPPWPPTRTWPTSSSR